MSSKEKECQQYVIDYKKEVEEKKETLYKQI